MFVTLGRLAYRFRWLVVAIWGIVFLASIPILPRVTGSLQMGGFTSPETESYQAERVLQRELGFAPSSMVVIFQSETLRASDAAFQTQMTATLAAVHDLPYVTGIVTPALDPNLVSDDGDTAYVVVSIALADEEAQAIVPEFEAALAPAADLEVLVGGGPAFNADLEQVTQSDLQRAELIAFPFAGLVLLIVFGSVVAAAVPLVVGAAGVAVILSLLHVAASNTDVSIFALNLATMLGLGLAIDYSLFITSRFREELRRTPADIGRAVERTVATAGRAVFFSGLTVLIGLSGLVFFSFMFLRSVGIAGVIVVLGSTLASLTLLPAVLGILGHRIDRWRVPMPAFGRIGDGFWLRLSRWVMAHPVMVLIPTLTLLLLLGSPFRHANISSPDVTILPESLPSRQAFEVLAAEFGRGEISPLLLVFQSPTSVFRPEHLGQIHDLTQRLANDPRIDRVQSIVPAIPGVSRGQRIALAGVQQGLSVLGVNDDFQRIANANTTVVFAYPRLLPNDDRSKALLAEVRATALTGDLSLLVTGGTAGIVDVVEVMYRDFPIAIALVMAATYLVLLILFRSLLLPLKAIVMNSLSILASYGALVWIFQDGNLSGFLGFSALGFVEASLPVILFCVLFGLSMDYEVFLLSRVREEWDRTGDNTEAVAMGLQRSGRIITSAALLVVVVTASFVTAEVVLIKAVGLGIAIAVFLDATVVRALLVPATMRLLGDWNWWLPEPLRRILPAHALDEAGHRRESEGIRGTPSIEARDRYPRA
ncbi:MAG: MMPL family transporter [Chloroflexota bacterium]|nr:MMPL family transporter [Chloroflexota bacterium]